MISHAATSPVSRSNCHHPSTATTAAIAGSTPCPDTLYNLRLSSHESSSHQIISLSHHTCLISIIQSCSQTSSINACPGCLDGVRQVLSRALLRPGPGPLAVQCWTGPLPLLRLLCGAQTTINACCNHWTITTITITTANSQFEFQRCAFPCPPLPSRPPQRLFAAPPPSPRLTADRAPRPAAPDMRRACMHGPWLVCVTRQVCVCV